VSEDWWTKKQACTHLGITRQTLSGYITSGAVKVYGRGKEKLVRRDEVQAEYRRRALRRKTGRFGHAARDTHPGTGQTRALLAGANHYVTVASALSRGPSTSRRGPIAIARVSTFDPAKRLVGHRGRWGHPS